MNKLRILIASLLMALSLTTPQYDLGNTYPRAMEIVSLETETDTVVCVDAVGLEWAFYGIEDYFIGDIVICTMHDNGTQNIYDDSIIDTTFSGYTLPINE